jgi:Flp pilus assembly protein TadG
MKRPRRWWGRSRGTAAVEFAAVAPLFFLLLSGVIVYGLYFATEIAITVAATEGARASLAGLTTTERSSLAQAAAASVLGGYAPLVTSGGATVTAAPSAANALLFQVTVRYSFNVAGFGVIPTPTAATFTATVSNGGY